MMACNYLEYKALTEKLLDGVVLSDQRLTRATEEIRRYLADDEVKSILKELGVGIEVVTKQAVLPPEEKKEVSKRFVWLSGSREKEKLTIDEIKGIGMFLPQGALYGKQITEKREDRNV